MNPFELTKPCCEVWPKILGVFSWMAFQEQPEVLTMANINHSGTSWRVNHCPACGASVRDATVSVEQVLDSRAGL